MPAPARISVPRSPIAPALTRASLRSLEPDVGPERMFDLLLLTTEVVTNAVRHADGQPNDEIDVTVSCVDDAVRVEVADRGAGFEPRERPPPSERGWGLFLVDHLAERWGVERTGNRTIVWFELAA